MAPPAVRQQRALAARWLSLLACAFALAAAAVGSPAPPADAVGRPLSRPAGAATGIVAGPAAIPAQPSSGPRVAFKITDPRISESSGLAASRRHRGVVYTHNDSGGRPQVYAIGQNGRVRATLTLAGAAMRDWEGIAAGRDEAGRPVLYVADIGDNLGGAWPYVTVYRIPEPAKLRSQTLRATSYRLKYADGPRDAEAVLIHPKTNRLYVVSKVFTGKLYAAPRRLRAGRTNALREVGPAPVVATDGAYAPDGSTFAIRTYFAVNIYTAPGKLLEVVQLPQQEQGESITYTADGRALLAGSEFTNQPVWQIPLPKRALPTPSATARRDQGAGSAQEGGPGKGLGGSTAKTLVFLIFAVLVASAVVAAMRRRAR